MPKSDIACKKDINEQITQTLQNEKASEQKSLRKNDD